MENIRQTESQEYLINVGEQMAYGFKHTNEGVVISKIDSLKQNREVIGVLKDTKYYFTSEFSKRNYITTSRQHPSLFKRALKKTIRYVELSESDKRNRVIIMKIKQILSI